jgi:hypothetical protein
MKITKGKVARPQRVVLYSVEGVGKTTLASQLPSPLFLDTEKGSDHLDVSRIQITTWKEVKEALKLATSAKEYKTLVVDTADGLEDLLAKELCKAQGVDGIEQLDGGYGKGYAKLADKWGEFLSGDLEPLLNAGLHVVLLVHAQAKKFTEPGKDTAYDRFELLQSKQCAPLTKGWADEVWFANFKTTIIEEKGKATIGAGGKERILHTSHAPSHDAKTRAGLPEKVPMTFEAIKRVFEVEPQVAAEPKPDRNIQLSKKRTEPEAEAAPVVEEPSSPADEIPMVHHPLDMLFQGQDEQKINAFMVKRGEIKEGQTFRDASASYVGRILASAKSQEAFLGAALK